jgi:hypothetical protein
MSDTWLDIWIFFIFRYFRYPPNIGAHFTYYGQIDPTTLSSNFQHMQASMGYVATTFNVIRVFGVVLLGFY